MADLDAIRKQMRAKKIVNSSSPSKSVLPGSGSIMHNISEDAEHHFHLAECYDFGRDGYPRDLKAAYKEYLHAAELGHPRAMAVVGACYATEDNNIIGYDLKKAKEWGIKALELGNNDGYAILYIVNLQEQNGEEALQLLKKGCTIGSTYCLELKANLLYWGGTIGDITIEEDEEQAIEILTSVEWSDDNIVALDLLGDIAHNQNNNKLALGYYERVLSTDPENYSVMSKLGTLLRTADEVKDYNRALQLLKTAAEGGDITAMNGFGVMLYLGEGIEQDGRAAMEWLKKAARGGHTGAMINLGDIFADENQEEAIYWYKRAADEGNSDGEERLKNLQNNDASYDTSRSDNIYKTQLDNIDNTLSMNHWVFPSRLSGIQKVIDGGDLSDFEADRLRLLQGWMSLVYFHEHYLDEDFDEYGDDYYAILDRIDEIVKSMDTISDEALYLYNVANMYSAHRFKYIEPLDKLEQLWSDIQTIELDEAETEFKVSWWENIAKEIYELMGRIHTSESSSSNRQVRSNNDDYIKNRVMNIISEKLGIDREDIHLYSRLVENLGADSLDAVELIMEMENEFDITIPDSVAEKIRTVGDIISYIKNNR